MAADPPTIRRRTVHLFPMDLVEEAQELLMRMTGQATGQDVAPENFHRRKQPRCAIPFVVVSHRAASTLLDRQSRLCTIQRLNLRLPIDREHQRAMWWGCIAIRPNRAPKDVAKRFISKKSEIA